MLEIFKTLARSVFGMNHVANHENQYLEIVGNGLDAEHPRNARTLDIAGNEVLAGRLTVGAQPVDDNDVATKKYVDDNGGGGGGGVFTIELSYDVGTNTTVMNKTAQEIIEAANSGKMLWVYYPNPDANPTTCGLVTMVNVENSTYYVSVALGTSAMFIDGREHSIVPVYQFIAASLTDYPSSESL